MFGIGSGEMLIFAVVVLIALGPKRLPEFMKMVGKGLREVRKATTDLRKHSGIDELMRDDPAGLRALTQDINRAPAPRRDQKLTAEDRAKEAPIEGVDIAHAEHQARKNRTAAATAAATVAVAPTVPVVSSEPPKDLVTGFEGDTEPDKAAAAGPKVAYEPTMMGIPAVDPYADAKVALELAGKGDAAKRAAGKTQMGMPAVGVDAVEKAVEEAKAKTEAKAKSAAAAKPSVPPPPPPRAKGSVPPPPPPGALPKPSRVPTMSGAPAPGAKPSVPPPPPPPRIRPSQPPPAGKSASLPGSIPPPSSPPPVGEGSEAEAEAETETEAADPPKPKPNEREATMALEVEDLTLMDES